MAIGIILLAAGTSQRMGRPKALLPWGDSVLIEPVMRAFTQIQGPKIMVAGAERDSLAPLGLQYGFQTIYNLNPSKGQSESVKVGVGALQAWAQRMQTSLEGFFCAVCDQPLLEATQIEKLVEKWRSLPSEKRSKAIVIPRYGVAKHNGSPVFFGWGRRQDLMALTGDEGARQIWQKNSLVQPYYVTFTEENPDIDTPLEYINLYEKYHGNDNSVHRNRERLEKD